MKMKPNSSVKAASDTRSRTHGSCGVHCVSKAPLYSWRGRSELVCFCQVSRPLNGSSLLVGLAETTGDDVIKDWFKQLLSLRIQELRESRGGHPGLPVHNSPCGLCGRKATLNLNSYIC